MLPSCLSYITSCTSSSPLVSHLSLPGQGKLYPAEKLMLSYYCGALCLQSAGMTCMQLWTASPPSAPATVLSDCMCASGLTRYRVCYLCKVTAVCVSVRVPPVSKTVLEALHGINALHTLPLTCYRRGCCCMRRGSQAAERSWSPPRWLCSSSAATQRCVPQQGPP